MLPSSQSLGLDLVNINVYAKFSEFGARQSLDQDKCHFAISWTRCRQYQCVCKILSNYSKRFKSYRHFSRTGRGQNLHKLSGDKIKCLIIRHSMKVNFQFQLTFLGSCNDRLLLVQSSNSEYNCYIQYLIL